MPYKRYFAFLFILIWGLTSCRGTESVETTVNPPQTIRFGLPPSLAYLREPIAACANANPSFDVLLLEKNSLDWIKEPVDLVFTLQKALPNTTYTYLIDEIDIVIIASLDFPLDKLQQAQLEQIFNPLTLDPPKIGLPDTYTPTIWGFEEGSDLADLFETRYHFSAQLPVEAYLAVGPQSMLEKVSQSDHAVGYTLSSVVNSKVKILPIVDAAAAEPIAVIASFKLPPSDAQQALIRCLQTPAE
jgi:hypothetical protein